MENERSHNMENGCAALVASRSDARLKHKTTDLQSARLSYLKESNVRTNVLYATARLN